MNKLSFAVAAVYFAAMAKAQQCASQSGPAPAQDQVNKRLQAELNFAYLDQCPQDQKISFEEYEALIDDIDQLGLDGPSYEEKVRSFQMLDLDNNQEISLDELLQAYRVYYSPVDLQGSLPPFSRVKDQLFTYLKCNSQQGTDDLNCKEGYTREDLKSVLPTILPLDNILDDYVSFEAYVNHEFALRDTNYNGIVEQWEQHKHDWHYKFIRGFWNHSKGAGNVRETLADDGIMTFDQWNQQDNMMIRRDYAPDAVIPDDALLHRFYYFDRNRDGQLSWWEYWSTIQEDDLQHWHWRNLVSEIDGILDLQGEGDRIIQREEVEAYMELEYPGKTAAEIEELVQGFFIRYDAKTRRGTADGTIDYWPFWGMWHWEIHQAEAGNRREKNEVLDFDQNIWYISDRNRDKTMTFDELLVSYTVDQAVELYQIVGKDPTIEDMTYDELKQAITGADADMRRNQFHTAVYAINNWYRDYDAEINGQREFYTIDMVNMEDPEIRMALGVETQEDLEALWASMDKDGNGQVTNNEVCRQFMGDFDFYCSDDGRKDVQITDPDYHVPTEFDRFWSSFDQMLIVNDQVALADWIDAVTEVNMFDDMTEEQILAQFDLHDLNDDELVTKDEAQHVFYHAETIQEVTETINGMWDTVDQDENGDLDETEFLAAYEVLHELELLPDSDATAILEVYNDQLVKYNDSVATPEEQVSVLPMTAVLDLMREATVQAWNDILNGTTGN